MFASNIITESNLVYFWPRAGEVAAPKHKKKRVRKEPNGVDDVDGMSHISVSVQHLKCLKLFVYLDLKGYHVVVDTFKSCVLYIVSIEKNLQSPHLKSKK